MRTQNSSLLLLFSFIYLPCIMPLFSATQQSHDMYVISLTRVSEIERDNDKSTKIQAFASYNKTN